VINLIQTEVGSRSKASERFTLLALSQVLSALAKIVSLPEGDHKTRGNIGKTMPTVAVEKDLLFTHLGKSYSDTAFDELCFEFGIELDDVTSEREEAQKSSTVKLNEQQIAALSDKVIYKIDVPANRYDLLCVEGLSRALRIFLGDQDAPEYKYAQEEPGETLTVKKVNTDTIRPFVVGAILKDLVFTQERYESFIDLQDQLHRNLCRQRTLAAIGTHDLDTIEGPFVYDARPGTDIEFVPLTPDDRSFNAKELLEYYETEVAGKHLKPYVPIIKDSHLYPVIVDSQNRVLSLPPIINGSHSKITLDTKNVFIECTATDLTKANIVLDTMVTMFSEYSASPFTVVPVKVQYEDASGNIVDSYVTPKLSTRREQARVDFCNSLIGINISASEMQTLCNKVQLGPAVLLENDTILEVTVPPTRPDILHAVDIAEDVGIAYGYNNIVKRVPNTNTVGGEFPLNQIGDLLRDEIGRAGYTEVLTHGLCSIHDNFTALQCPVLENYAVSLSNPANIEYQVVRTTLLPGLLKTLQHNKSASFTNGFKLFEISDVVVQDDTNVITDTIVGAKNVRKLAAVYAGPTSGFEVVHGLVDRIMTLTEVAPEESYVGMSIKKEEKFRVSREGWHYTIAPLPAEGAHESKMYFAGRAAQILLTKPGVADKIRLGTFGILHPLVLKNFDVQYPCSVMELDLEELM
jgi:phenylalanyl-tRNA synthetase beta chain